MSKIGELQHLIRDWCQTDRQTISNGAKQRVYRVQTQEQLLAIAWLTQFTIQLGETAWSIKNEKRRVVLETV